jgi:cytochrome c biogenesis protein CcdA
MRALLLSVFGLALIDSINPSALGVTLYLLLSGRSARARVLVYIAGVFLTYFVLGILLMLGLESIQAYLYSSAAYAVQGVVGALLLIYGIFAPGEPKKKARTETRVGSRNLGGLFLLGVTVTVLEFTTALPYLGAIGLLTAADLAATQWLLILLFYTIIFVLPPLGLLLAYSMFGKRLEQRFASWQERLRQGARTTWLWIAALVGFFLLADSLRYFEFFGLIDIPNTVRDS